MDLAELLESELQLLAQGHRLRSTRRLDGRGKERFEGETPLLSFASNDYLGLATHASVVRAAAQAAERWGAGSSGARLVTGAYSLQDDLENELALFLTLPSALLFPTGYQANLGLITALAGQEDLIVSDSLNHASLIDGCRLSRARVAIYRHADAQHAAALLETPGAWRRKFLVTESLFSMDGDVAPLADLAAAAHRHQAHLLVDEAHAIGTQGPSGRGLCAAANIAPAALTGTFGKAFGASGAFVAGSTALRAYLVNRARPFVFTTAPPPPSIAAAREALSLIQTEGSHLLRTLHALAVAVRHASHPAQVLGASTSPILPLVLGSETKALHFAAVLRDHGIFVPAIRPPTVPEGGSRLRMTVSVTHTAADLDRLHRALGQASSTW